MKINNPSARAALLILTLCWQFGVTAVAAEDSHPPTQFVYKTVGERKLTVDVDYPPDWKPGDQRPGIVFFFGGEWTFGGPGQFKSQGQYFAKRGLVCVRVDYRLRTKDHVKIDNCVEDAMSAMRWVRSHTATLGIDPNRIVAAGGSAGGHLAACTFLVEGISSPADEQSVSPKPNALILYNPVLNLIALRDTKYTFTIAGMDDALLKQISPFFHASKQMPPTLFIDGAKDIFNAEIREFVQKSTDLGAPVEAKYWEDQPHGFFNKSPWKEQTTERADEFLRHIGYLGENPKVPLTDKTETPEK